MRRGALPSALALLALVVQLLIPAASLAHEARSAGPTVVLCTLDGAKTVSVPGGDQPRHGFGGLKCHDCVMVSVAAVATGETVAVPVRYAAESRIAPADRTRTRAHRRAPPRPPSTAPPAFRTV